LGRSTKVILDYFHFIILLLDIFHTPAHNAFLMTQGSNASHTLELKSPTLY